MKHSTVVENLVKYRTRRTCDFGMSFAVVESGEWRRYYRQLRAAYRPIHRYFGYSGTILRIFVFQESIHPRQISPLSAHGFPKAGDIDPVTVKIANWLLIRQPERFFPFSNFLPIC